MTYLEIDKFYYDSNSGSGNTKTYYLKIKGGQVSGQNYKIDFWDPENSPGDAATGTITFQIIATAAGDSYQDVCLGDHEVGVSKNLTIIAEENGTEKESSSKNYNSADPQ